MGMVVILEQIGLSQMSSQAACMSPMYSDSVLKRAMIGCFFKLQLIALPT